GFYETARAAADEIISDGPYSLYEKVADPTENFYKLFVDKNDNPEVMWVRDFKGKDCVQYWAAGTCPAVTAFGSTNRCMPLLNLVEAYEYLDNRDGSLKVADDKGDYIFYDDPAELFLNKDPRMKATVICNGDQFAGKTIVYQAGQLKTQNKKWRKTTGAPGVTDVDGDVITGENGPRASSGLYDNVTGFNFRKYSEEEDAARQPSTGSEVWNIYVRFAEVKLIRAEALLELGRADEGLADINDIRKRAGLGKLTSYTIADIEQERRVEFPLEGHRYWDLKRWRRSHVVWDGESDSAIQWALFPYKVKDPRSQENGRWAFERVANNKRPMPRKFELRNYYNFLHNSWLANNPKLVKNPFQ
ncbi:MAG: RagB/SusD family nutrient uptake outer membrane protein, partial [Muribaculaceae bacterium]|nr:RagB/SusD family nutrient uptake outer membrane protein [Muribaculaceae bacterium]